MSKLSDRIREKAREIQEKAKRLIREAEEARKRADQKAKDLANAVSEKAKADAKRALEITKQLADKAKKDAQHAVGEVKNINKKIKLKLRDLHGKLRKAYKKALRKRMLVGIYLLIRANANGTASMLFPSIASPSELKIKNTKASFVPKSKAVYNKVLAKWESLGGKKSKLDEAIRKGGHLRILKPSKGVSVKINKTGFDGDVQSYALPYPNNSSHNFVQNSGNKNVINLKQSEIFDWVYGNALVGFDGSKIPNADVVIYSGADGTDDYSTEALTPEEQAELDNYDVEVEETENKRGIKAFIAWIRGLFNRPKAESPYEDGGQFEEELNIDASYAPELTAEDLAFLNGIDPAFTDPKDTGGSGVDVKEGDATDEDDGESEQIISGIPNGVFWGGVVVLSLGAIWGGWKLYQHFKK